MPETSGDASGDGSQATGMEIPSIILLAYRRIWRIKIGSNPDFNLGLYHSLDISWKKGLKG
jgi:hypothetical protein